MISTFIPFTIFEAISLEIVLIFFWMLYLKKIPYIRIKIKLGIVFLIFEICDSAIISGHYIFYCCKQSLEELLHPSIYPPRNMSSFPWPILLKIISFPGPVSTATTIFSKLSQFSSFSNFPQNNFISLANFLSHHYFCTIV